MRLALAAALGLWLGAAPAVAKGKAHTITCKSAAFDPRELTVRAGDTVEWRNEDIFPHDIKAKDGAFRSKDLAPQQSYKWVARKRGSYPYVCTLHPVMTGTITVK